MAKKNQEPKDIRKGGRKLHNDLSAAFVRDVKEPGRYFDGMGLFLLVKEAKGKQVKEQNGQSTVQLTKGWKQRLNTERKKRREFGLGTWPTVSLAQARKAAQLKYLKVKTGEDPKEEAEEVPTFKEVAKIMFNIRASTLTNDDYRNEWLADLEHHVFPKIGSKSVAEVSAQDVLDVLLPIWGTMPKRSRVYRQRMAMVLNWAIVQRYRLDNPADAVRVLLPRRRTLPTSYRALEYQEVQAALDQIKASTANRITRLAFEFMVVTAARAIEVRCATWKEFDLGKAVWVIEPERMKNRRLRHRVPLCERALEILREVSEIAPGCEGNNHPFVYSSGELIGRSAFSQMLRRLKLDSSPHGFRSSFRTWVQEHTEIGNEAAGLAISHAFYSDTEGPYARSDLLEKRRPLMESWAKYLQGETPLHRDQGKRASDHGYGQQYLAFEYSDLGVSGAEPAI